MTETNITTQHTGGLTKADIENEIPTSFIPRLDICHPMSKVFERDIAERGHYVFNNETDLGPQIHCFLITTRFCAMVLGDGGIEEISYNPDNPKYQEIRTACLAKKGTPQGWLFGIQVLVWVFDNQQFAMYYFGKKTTRELGKRYCLPQDAYQREQTEKRGEHIGGLLRCGTIWTVDRRDFKITKDGKKIDAFAYVPVINFVPEETWRENFTVPDLQTAANVALVRNFENPPEAEIVTEESEDRPR